MGLTGYLKSRGEDYTVANYRQCTIEEGTGSDLKQREDQQPYGHIEW